MTNKNSQSGFSVISLIVTILVITGIGLAGYYVWHKNHQQDKKQTTSKNESQSTQKSSNSQSASDPTEGGKYLVIKEWGVRFPLPPEFKDKLRYNTFGNTVVGETAVENGQNIQGDGASFTTTDLTANPDNSCELKEGETGGRISLFRAKEKSFEYSEYNGKRIDGMYYWFMKGNGGACSEDANNIDLVDKFVSEMRSALINIEKVKE